MEIWINENFFFTKKPFFSLKISKQQKKQIMNKNKKNTIKIK